MIVKATRLGALTVGALDHLAQTDECCTFCCAFCWVLRDMHNRGDLDTVVQAAPERMVLGSEWWDERHNGVDRLWLTNKWLYTSCDHGVEDSDEPSAEEDDPPSAQAA